MPFEIVTSDLISMEADAVIYAETKHPFSMFQFNPLTLHEKGKELPKSRESLGHFAPGDAKIVPASKINARYIIHTSAPVWHGGSYHELGQLRSCYEKSFQLAVENGCRTIGLPIIATDRLGYPKKITRQMAFDCINQFLRQNDRMIYLTFPKRISIILPGNQYVEVNKMLEKELKESAQEHAVSSAVTVDFHAVLTKWIEKKELNSAEICVNGNISPAVLSEIMADASFSPDKNQALAFGIALKLTLEELKEFLAAAGYTLDGSSKSDLIIKYCISKGIYDIWNINQILFRFEAEQIVVK